MAKTVEAYLQGLSGWQAQAAAALRRHIRAADPGLVEAFKWAQPVYECNGPVCYFKAHKNHITFGFWRGVDLMALDARLESSGTKMAHLKLRGPADVDPPTIARLVRAATGLNRSKGDPTRG